MRTPVTVTFPARVYGYMDGVAYLCAGWNVPWRVWRASTATTSGKPEWSLQGQEGRMANIGGGPMKNISKDFEELRQALEHLEREYHRVLCPPSDRVDPDAADDLYHDASYVEDLAKYLMHAIQDEASQYIGVDPR